MRCRIRCSPSEIKITEPDRNTQLLGHLGAICWNNNANKNVDALSAEHNAAVAFYNLCPSLTARQHSLIGAFHLLLALFLCSDLLSILKLVCLASGTVVSVQFPWPIQSAEYLPGKPDTAYPMCLCFSLYREKTWRIYAVKIKPPCLLELMSKMSAATM